MICQGDSAFWRGVFLSEAGIYRDTVTNDLTGCRIIHEVSVTVNPSYLFEETVILCSDELPYQWHGITLNEAGSREIFLQTAGSFCDSIYRLTLVVNPASHTEETATVCDYDLPFLWHGQTLTESGIYYDTLVTTAGSPQTPSARTSSRTYGADSYSLPPVTTPTPCPMPLAALTSSNSTSPSTRLMYRASTTPSAKAKLTRSTVSTPSPHRPAPSTTRSSSPMKAAATASSTSSSQFCPPISSKLTPRPAKTSRTLGTMASSSPKAPTMTALSRPTAATPSISSTSPSTRPTRSSSPTPPSTDTSTSTTTSSSRLPTAALSTTTSSTTPLPAVTPSYTSPCLSPSTTASKSSR